MAIIKRHWKLALLNVFLIILGLAGLTWYSLRTGAPASKALASADAAPSSPTPLDSLTYSRIGLLRQKLCLTTEDLAAMGCTQNQATTLFAGLLSWYQSNSAAWTSGEQQIASARASLQQALQQINVGPKNPALIAQVPTLQSNLAAAQAGFAQLQQGAAASISSGLSDQQQQIWSIAKANVAAKVPDQYRYVPNITQEQSKALVLAMASRGAIDDSTILGVSQQQSMSSARTTQGQSGNGILAAQAGTLPPPVVQFAAAGQPAPKLPQ